MKRNKLLMVLFIFLIVFSLFLTVKVSAKEVAPNFTLTDIDGNEFSLSDYRGKIVLLDFFRIIPDCPPCIEAIPHLKSLHETFGEGLVIISISVGSETLDDLQQFRDDYEIGWTIAKGTLGVSDDYTIQYIPTLVIVDQDGYIRYRHVGLTEESVLSDEINAIMSPTANFTYRPSSPRPNMTVTFDASTSLPGFNGTRNIPIVNYTWDFGDGNIATVPSPVITHKYMTDDTYTVNLNVTCAYDPKLPTTRNSTTKTITVSMEPSNGDASPGFPVWLAVMLVLFVAAIILYIIFK